MMEVLGREDRILEDSTVEFYWLFEEALVERSFLLEPFPSAFQVIMSLLLIEFTVS